MMKYFRSYPWWVQIALLFLVLISMAFLGSVCLSILVPKLTGINIEALEKLDEHSSPYFVKVAVITLGVGSLFIFMIPALLFSYLAHPDPLPYVGLRKPGKAIQPILTLLMMLGAIPLLEELQLLISRIDFGASIKASQAANDSMMKAILNMPTLGDFLRTLIVMAVIPAIGEELFFRGLLMRFTAKATKNIWFSIAFTSVVFAYSHSNLYGLVSIFLAGSLLALAYYLTGSIWCGILAHLGFNGSQVVLSYLANNNAAIRNFENSDSLQWWMVAGGAVVFLGSLVLLIRNRTPLAPTWTEDFDRKLTVPEESEQSDIF